MLNQLNFNVISFTLCLRKSSTRGKKRVYVIVNVAITLSIIVMLCSLVKDSIAHCCYPMSAHPSTHVYAPKTMHCSTSKYSPVAHTRAGTAPKL